MKIYDISRELFASDLFPGDPFPVITKVMDLQRGEVCNLSSLQMSAHTGTHIDAPLHFLQQGKDVEQLDLDKCVGSAVVLEAGKEITVEDMRRAVQSGMKRVLFKGGGTLTKEAVEEAIVAGLFLIGTENVTIGGEEEHIALLTHEVVLLENILLQNVPEGAYLLVAAPIKVKNLEGAPCRALLLVF